MNFDDLIQVWRSSHNRPSLAQLESDKMKFITDLRRRHRTFVTFMTMVFGALVFITGKILFHLLWPGSTTDPIDFKREWAVISFFMLPWAVWICLLLQYRRHRARHPAYETSIKASLQALLDENRITRRRNVVIVCLQVGFMLILPLIIHQLKTVGKAGSEINVMFVAVPVIFGGIMVGMAYNYWRTLAPRKRQLEALLHSYESDMANGRL